MDLHPPRLPGLSCPAILVHPAAGTLPATIRVAPHQALSFMASATLITLTGVQLAYGHHALLAHADFTIQAGERIGLIGRNGAGKSGSEARRVGKECGSTCRSWGAE